MQARTPAVPEERAQFFEGVTEGPRQNSSLPWASLVLFRVAALDWTPCREAVRVAQTSVCMPRLGLVGTFTD